MVKTTTFKWAERTDKVYVTIDLEDCKDPKIEVKEGKEIIFKGVGGTSKEEYEVTVPLFKEVDVETSKWAVGARSIVFVLMKKEEGYWERLLPKNVKMHNCKTDFDKWVDEDEEQTDADFGGMDFSGMGGMDDAEIVATRIRKAHIRKGGMAGMEQMMAQMGGMGGMPGMEGMGDMGPLGDEDDSDNEDDMPPLEDAAPEA